MLKNKDKKFFLIATGDPERMKKISDWITAKFSDSVIFTATDYMECLLKIKNAPPNILITEYELAKSRPGQAIDNLILDKNSNVAIIVLDSRPRSDAQVDAVAMGRLCFIENITEITQFHDAIMKVANYAFNNEVRPFNLKFLKPGEILIKEGDSCKNVYIVKKGELRAYKTVYGGERVVLGDVHLGEFVGEMAFFVGENRMASVEAVTDCEVIEVPPLTFERVIYQRPSWIKTLFETLARRLMRKSEIQKSTKV